MARKSANSPIYGIEDHSYAEDLASRSLANEIVVNTDSIGLMPEKFGIPVDHVLPDQSAQTHGKTGSAKGGHTHRGDVCGGSDEIENKPARHEHQSLRDESPTHAGRSITGSPDPLTR